MPFLARTSLFRTGLLAAAVCATAASACGDPPHWGYDNLASPSQWAGIAPACAGPQQSPIDLLSSDIQHGAKSALESD